MRRYAPSKPTDWTAINKKDLPRVRGLAPKTYALDGRVVKEGQSRKFVPKVQENMAGFTGTGREVKPIREPKRIERFDGKRYHIHKEVA